MGESRARSPSPATKRAGRHLSRFPPPPPPPSPHNIIPYIYSIFPLLAAPLVTDHVSDDKIKQVKGDRRAGGIRPRLAQRTRQPAAFPLRAVGRTRSRPTKPRRRACSQRFASEARWQLFIAPEVLRRLDRNGSCPSLRARQALCAGVRRVRQHRTAPVARRGRRSL